MIIIVIILVIFLLLITIRTVKTNEALVVWGFGIKNGSKIKTGGAILVIPLLQRTKVMSLDPIVVDIDLKGALSSENIRVDTPSTFTIHIGGNPELLTVASTKLLDLSLEQIDDQASDIILGQLRSVIASMKIEEINKDREKFEVLVSDNVGASLASLGLSLINVNVKDIKDVSGYIEAIGQQAASAAVNKAHVDVARETKDGHIGVAQAEKEEKIFISKAESEKQIGISENNKIQEIKVAEFDAEMIESKTISKIREKEAEKNLAVKQAEFEKITLLAQTDAEIQVQRLRADSELEKIRANEISKVKAEKEKIELEALAFKNKLITEAEASAKSITLNAEAESESISKIATAKAEGYQKLVDAVGKDNIVQILLTEKAEELATIRSESLKNIKIDKVTVFDGGQSSRDDNKGALSGFVDDVTKILPITSEIALEGGIEIPSWMGKVVDKKDKEAE